MADSEQRLLYLITIDKENNVRVPYVFMIPTLPDVIEDEGIDFNDGFVLEQGKISSKITDSIHQIQDVIYILYDGNDTGDSYIITDMQIQIEQKKIMGKFESSNINRLMPDPTVSAEVSSESWPDLKNSIVEIKKKLGGYYKTNADVIEIQDGGDKISENVGLFKEILTEFIQTVHVLLNVPNFKKYLTVSSLDIPQLEEGDEGKKRAITALSTFVEENKTTLDALTQVRIEQSDNSLVNQNLGNMDITTLQAFANYLYEFKAKRDMFPAKSGSESPTMSYLIDIISKKIDAIETFLGSSPNLIDRINKNADLLRGINIVLRNTMKTNILTYLKIRNDDNNKQIYNRRFDIEKNKSGKSKHLLLRYNDDNMRYYENDGLVVSELGEKLSKAVSYNGTNDITITSYDHNYIFGEFTQIFHPDETNREIAEHMQIVKTQLDQGKPVFIIGYGASGAGKTSSLIYYNKGTSSETKDGILSHLCDQMGKESGYRDLEIEYREFYDSGGDKNRSDEPVNTDCMPVAFKYNDAKQTFVLNEDYVHTNHHTYRIYKESNAAGTGKDCADDSNNTTNFTAGSPLGEVMIHLIDKDRHVKATTNNPNSSRSHSLIFVKLKKADNQSAHLIVGDFAGVENVFDCTNPSVLTDFMKIKKDNSTKLFYEEEKCGDTLDPIGSENTVCSTVSRETQEGGTVDNQRMLILIDLMDKRLTLLENKAKNASGNIVSTPGYKKFTEAYKEAYPAGETGYTKMVENIHNEVSAHSAFTNNVALLEKITIYKSESDNIPTIDKINESRNALNIVRETLIAKSQLPIPVKTKESPVQPVSSEPARNINITNNKLGSDMDIYDFENPSLSGPFKQKYSILEQFGNDQTQLKESIGAVRTCILKISDDDSKRVPVEKLNTYYNKLDNIMSLQQIWENRSNLDTSKDLSTLIQRREEIKIKDMALAKKKADFEEIASVLQLEKKVSPKSRDDFFKRLRNAVDNKNQYKKLLVEFTPGSRDSAAIMGGLARTIYESNFKTQYSKKIPPDVSIYDTILTEFTNKYKPKDSSDLINANQKIDTMVSALNQDFKKLDILMPCIGGTSFLGTGNTEAATTIKQIFPDISDDIRTKINIILSEEFFTFIKEMESNRSERLALADEVCSHRKTEGTFINDSLKQIRNEIRQMLYQKNKDALAIIPNYVDICFDKYCPSHENCFSFTDTASKKSSDTTKSVIFDEIYKYLQREKTDYTREKMYEDLLITVFCVFNISKRANNPPPAPYVDVNELKRLSYNYDIFGDSDMKNKFIENADMLIKTLTEKYIDTLESGEKKNKLAAIFDIQVPNDIFVDLDKSSPLYNLTRGEGTKKSYEVFKYLLDQMKKASADNIVWKTILADNSGYKNYIIDFLQNIDNINAASAVGTLEFLDRMAKLNLVSTVCNDDSEDQSIINNYTAQYDMIPLYDKKMSGGKKRYTKRQVHAINKTKKRATSK